MLFSSVYVGLGLKYLLQTGFVVSVALPWLLAIHSKHSNVMFPNVSALSVTDSHSQWKQPAANWTQNTQKNVL